MSKTHFLSLLASVLDATELGVRSLYVSHYAKPCFLRVGITAVFYMESENQA